VNQINFLLYIGTKDYSLKPDVNLCSLEVQTFMRIVHMKNILLSRNLATNAGTEQVPLDLMSMAYQNPPDWGLWPSASNLTQSLERHHLECFSAGR
jgi:hypothetical protein